MRANGYVTVVVPFDGDDKAAAVEQLLRAQVVQGKGNLPLPIWEAALRQPPRVIHFLSLNVIGPRSPMDGFTPGSRGDVSLLVLEVSSDTGAEETLRLVAAALEELLRDVLNQANPAGWTTAATLQQLGHFLVDHHIEIGTEWWRSMGQVHDGSPGMTVERILAECDLAKDVSDWISTKRLAKDQHWLDSSPMQQLDWVRREFWSRGEKWAFMAEPTPILEGEPEGSYQQQRAGASIAYGLLWPLWLVVTMQVLIPYFLSRTADDWPQDLRMSLAAFGLGILLLAVLWYLRPPRRFPFSSLVVTTLIVVATFLSLKWALLWLGLSAMTLLGLGAVIGGLSYWRFRVAEANDPIDDEAPDAERVRGLLAVENFGPQNHMFTISTIKPGLLRWIALRFTLTMIGANGFVSRPGFLGKSSVIHSARWLWLRDSRVSFFRFFDPGRLIFWSNFDGTWESYVGDFVADSPDGVTGLWSNCLGFPRARNLTDDGAKNRDRLVRWARRQQQPTVFWYSAYREVTNARIRINAAIRQGIACAQTDADARDWLSLFGSQPRAADTLVPNQIPTLVFGGLPSLPHATCYMIQFQGNASQARDWLNKALKHVTFGEVLPGQRSAVALALSASGLRKLDVPDEAIRTFPVAFQEGMSTPERARELGDEDRNAPEGWEWGGPRQQRADPTIDVFVAVYGREVQPQDDVQLEYADFLGPFVGTAIRVVESRRLNPRNEPGSGAAPRFQTEGFGFSDGVSQPIIRGLRRSDTPAAHNDLVGPGEFVLGYPDSLGRIPPTPLIHPSHDPFHVLADDAPLAPQRPNFARNASTGYRDLGANGTFLVVRDLEQHVDRWHDMLQKEAADIRRRFVVSVGDGGVGIVWGVPLPQNHKINPVDIEPAIAAKLVGRWQDGSTLVRHPMIPGGPGASRDNNFRFGIEDPQGLACPLGAHTRRANPRDTRFPGSREEIASVNRHRLLRVGRSYVMPDGKGGERQGLMFMCLNGDIERQFEFVQKTWLLNSNMSSLENETDPLLGPGGCFSIPTPGGVVKLELPPLTTVRGGGYFFMPGKAALTFLATMGLDPSLLAPGGGTFASAKIPAQSGKATVVA